ncbi:Os04g0611266, partial [Oryza sativa Japonica Group]
MLPIGFKKDLDLLFPSSAISTSAHPWPMPSWRRRGSRRNPWTAAEARGPAARAPRARRPARRVWPPPSCRRRAARSPAAACAAASPASTAATSPSRRPPPP